MRRLPATVLITSIFLSAPSLLNACIVRHMTYDEALAETDSMVLAEIVEILPSSETQFSRNFNYKIRIILSERGAMQAGALVDIELVLHLARNRNGSITCPLQRGSGTEHALEVGKRYRMLIKKEGNAYELFWGESPQTPERNRTTQV